MPRNGSGTFSIPTTASAGGVIASEDWNSNFDDVGDEITNSLALDGQSTMTGPVKAANGTVSAPSITFGSDTDSGLYRIGANNIGLALNGAKVLDISTAGLAVTGTLGGAFGDGSVGAPSIGFSGDTNTGLYRIGADNIGVATGGAKVLDIGAAGLGVSGVLTVSSTSHMAIAKGTTAQRPGSPADGDIRYNTDLTQYEGYDEEAEDWVRLVTSNQVAGDDDAGVLETATQTEMESASATDKAVTPGRQHFHPGAAKAWVKFNGTGTLAVNVSRNVTSVTDNGTGDYTINFSTSFGSAHYAIAGTGRRNATNNFLVVTVRQATDPTPSACRVISYATGSSGSDNTIEDAPLVSFTFHGDL
jgi:hypothetical protein